MSGSEQPPNDRAWTIPVHVGWRRLDGNALVVANVETGRYHVLVESAELIWRTVAALGTTEEAAEALCRRYGISRQQAGDDVRAFIASLVAEGYLIDQRQRRG